MEWTGQMEQDVGPGSWKQLTGEQLCILLQHYATDSSGCLYREWSLLKEKIKENDKEAAKAPREKFTLNGYVLGLLTYILSFITALHEKSLGTDLRDPGTADRIAVRYHLDRIAASEKYDFTYYIGQIIPARRSREPLSFEERKTECWNRIQEYLNCREPLSIQAPLGSLFDWLHEKNKQCQENDYSVTPFFWPCENSMDRSYELCLAILDDWWNQKTVRESLWIVANRGFPEKFPIARQVTDTAAKQEAEAKLEGNKFAKRAKDRIESGVKQIIFTGAPGTGKTYAARMIAEYMGGCQPWNEGGGEIYDTLVQFHPSYDYTDFVEGLRPVELRSGEIQFVKLDGQFKAFCRQVAEQGDPDERYFFIIDEINRAELSKVFGELMFCLEADKRGEKNRVKTQYQNLPTYDPKSKRYLVSKKEIGEAKDQGDASAREDVFFDGFFVPANVIVIGTMNDIDRSVESMDFALRRRFEWMEAVVDEDMLRDAFQSMGGALAAFAEELAKCVNSLNQMIEAKGQSYGLNRQYFISQGQFANLPEDRGGTISDIKSYAWDYRIGPLLREYLRGEAEESIQEFITVCREAFEPDWPERAGGK